MVNPCCTVGKTGGRYRPKQTIVVEGGTTYDAAFGPENENDTVIEPGTFL